MAKLTDRDKAYLKKIGYTDEDVTDIERGEYKYFSNYGRRASEEWAVRKLGRRQWASCIGRARFHRSSVGDCKTGNGTIYVERA